VHGPGHAEGGEESQGIEVSGLFGAGSRVDEGHPKCEKGRGPKLWQIVGL